MPQPYRVKISVDAKSNIRHAYLWIAESDKQAAKRWYDGLMIEIKSLSILPLRCPIAPEFRMGLIEKETRQFLYGKGYWKYRILFQVVDEEVGIVHIRHGARLYLGQEDDV